MDLPILSLISLIFTLLFGGYSLLRHIFKPQKNQKNQFFFSRSHTALEIRTQEGAEMRSLENLLHSQCPSLFTVFEPVWWLKNRHLQTAFTVMGKFKNIFVPSYDSKLIRMKDEGTLALDFYPSEPSLLSESTPILVILTGLTGSSSEFYVREVIAEACTSPCGGGTYRAVVVNYRGCGGVPLTSPKLYTCGNTDDLRYSLEYISNLYPNATLHGLGFSLGSALLTRYAAEEGEESLLRSLCCLACPWNMASNNRNILSTFIGRNVYGPALGFNLQAIIKKNLEVFRTSGARTCQAALDVVAVKGITIAKFDDTFSRKLTDYGPEFPFETLDELYEWGSSDHVLHRVQIPALYINADDDPIVSTFPDRVDGCPYVVLVATSGGGHLGWHTYGTKLGRVRRWTTKPVLEWLELMSSLVDHDSHKL